MRLGQSLCCSGHGHALQEWNLSWVRLFEAGLVWFLEDDHPPGFSGYHGYDVHGVAFWGLVFASWREGRHLEVFVVGGLVVVVHDAVGAIGLLGVDGGGHLLCFTRDVGLPGVDDGIRFLGFYYCVYFFGLHVGVQVCGLVDGGRVYGLTLCLLRCLDALGSFGRCPMGGHPRPRDAPPCVGWCSYDSWGAWASTEVVGLFCGYPKVGVFGFPPHTDVAVLEPPALWH